MAFTLTAPSHILDKPILQALDSTGQATAAHEPGYTVLTEDGREFKYVQFDNGSGNVAAVAGAPCAFAPDITDNEFVITSDISDGGAVGMGCFLSILTDSYYGWVQTAGFVKDVPQSGAQDQVAAGDPLYATDGVWKTGTIGTNHIAAVATETGAAAIGNIMILKN